MSTTPRYDVYAGIHKALRFFMSRTLCSLGSTDPGNPHELDAALDLLQRLLALCELHLKDENEFIHPALERAKPGTSAHIAAEHGHHAEAIAALWAQRDALRQAPAAERPAALTRLYRDLALFVAENFQHMEFEEREHNAILWANYSDAELLAIEQALVASIPPAAMMEAMHWFIPALNASERAGMLGGMQQGMPAPAFEAVLAIAERTLETGAHARLLRALGRGELARLAA